MQTKLWIITQRDQKFIPRNDQKSGQRGKIDCTQEWSLKIIPLQQEVKDKTYEAYEKYSQHLRNNQIQFKNCKPSCE